MGGDSLTQDSMSDSTLSKTSGDGLIAKSPQKKSKPDLKFRERHETTAEEQKDSFKWIPNPTDSLISDKRGQSTLESVSSSTTSDFSSTGYCRNGYIRGAIQPQPLLKYNEFNSLMTSLGSCPVEVKPPQEVPSRPMSTRRTAELSGLLITGGVQMMLGILMAVFGVLIIVHNASLAGAGGGLWGGAVAVLSGLLGVLAGLRGCYASKNNRKTSPALLTAYLAMCLVSFALSNLVLVLTATGLIRDINQQKSADADEARTVNWPPVLSDTGLIIASALQCVLSVISGYKCYRRVCPCSRRHSRLQESESGTSKIDGKVTTWLGQQLPSPKKKRLEGTQSMPWGAPSIVLLPPPPRMPPGPMPLWTFLHPSGPPLPPSSALYACCPNITACCCHHEVAHLPSVHGRRSASSSRRTNYIEPDAKMPREPRKKRNSRRERRISEPSTEDLARTYTGRDREIAEEFIAIAMDKSRRRSRASSTGGFTREAY